MDLKSLLNQALNSDFVKHSDLLKKGTQSFKSPETSTHSQTNSLSTSDHLKSLGAGALGGGLVNLLMGSKKSKNMTKKVSTGALKVGGAAALGALAYKVYNDWQTKQKNTTINASGPRTTSQDTYNDSDGYHSVLILKAMIAAAKADGHVDQQEMARIEDALLSIGADDSVRHLVQQELHKPLDPSEIAKLARSPQQASELYLASLIVADEQNFMEKAYLQELAKQLQLAPEVIRQLEQQLH